MIVLSLQKQLVITTNCTYNFGNLNGTFFQNYWKHPEFETKALILSNSANNLDINDCHDIENLCLCGKGEWAKMDRTKCYKA